MSPYLFCLLKQNPGFGSVPLSGILFTKYSNDRITDMIICNACVLKFDFINDVKHKFELAFPMSFS